MTERATLSRRAVIFLAIASSIVTANAYYIHPIIGRVAPSFEVNAAMVGAVPALNQIALALGVLLLLPLGDRISNRKLVVVCLAAQVLSLAAMAVVQSFWVFVAASTALGFFTVTPYLLPAYASKRVPVDRLGSVTAILTTGVVAGVLLSRTGSGVVAEIFGWRTVYVLATALMVLALIFLPLIMEEDEGPTDDHARTSYLGLLTSLVTLVSHHHRVMVSGVIQGLSFAVFLAFWMGIGLHLTSDEIGLGTDVVGYLAAFSALNLITTPALGRIADRNGPARVRLVMAMIQFVGVLSLALAGQSWWWLLLPIAVTSVAGPMIDVTGRMTTLREVPEVRTRLMSLYITLMFVGGGMGSWLGAAAYGLGGWTGTVLTAAGLSLCVLVLTACEYKLHESGRAQTPSCHH